MVDLDLCLHCDHSADLHFFLIFTYSPDCRLPGRMSRINSVLFAHTGQSLSVAENAFPESFLSRQQSPVGIVRHFAASGPIIDVAQRQLAGVVGSGLDAGAAAFVSDESLAVKAAQVAGIDVSASQAFLSSAPAGFSPSLCVVPCSALFAGLSDGLGLVMPTTSWSNHAAQVFQFYGK